MSCRRVLRLRSQFVLIHATLAFNQNARERTLHKTLSVTYYYYYYYLLLFYQSISPVNISRLRSLIVLLPFPHIFFFLCCCRSRCKQGDCSRLDERVLFHSLNARVVNNCRKEVHMYRCTGNGRFTAQRIRCEHRHRPARQDVKMDRLSCCHYLLHKVWKERRLKYIEARTHAKVCM